MGKMLAHMSYQRGNEHGMKLYEEEQVNYCQVLIKDSRRILMINKRFGVPGDGGRFWSMHVLRFMELCYRKANFTLWQLSEIYFRKTVFFCVLEKIKAFPETFL